MKLIDTLGGMTLLLCSVSSLGSEEQFKRELLRGGIARISVKKTPNLKMEIGLPQKMQEKSIEAQARRILVSTISFFTKKCPKSSGWSLPRWKTLSGNRTYTATLVTSSGHVELGYVLFQGSVSTIGLWTPKGNTKLFDGVIGGLPKSIKSMKSTP